MLSTSISASRKIKDVFEKQEQEALLSLLSKWGYSPNENINAAHPKTNSFILHDAIINDQGDILEKLLKEKNINLINQPCDHENIFLKGMTPVFLAIFYERLGMLKLLVNDERTNIRKRRSDGRTPLMFAAALGKTEALNVLLQRDARNDRMERSIDDENNIEDEDLHNMTALMYASWAGEISSIKTLLEYNASETNSVGKEFTTYFISKGAEKRVKEYLKERENIKKIEKESKGLTLSSSPEEKSSIKYNTLKNKQSQSPPTSLISCSFQQQESLRSGNAVNGYYPNTRRGREVSDDTVVLMHRKSPYVYVKKSGLKKFKREEFVTKPKYSNSQKKIDICLQCKKEPIKITRMIRRQEEQNGRKWAISFRNLENFERYNKYLTSKNDSDRKRAEYIKKGYDAERKDPQKASLDFGKISANHLFMQERLKKMPEAAELKPKMPPEEVMLPVLRFDLKSNESTLERPLLLPTEPVVIKDKPGIKCWLYASNNKYRTSSVDHEKVGKWMLFYPNDKINHIWERVQEGIKNGHLWHAKVSTADGKGKMHAIMIYTRNYSDLEDVIRVLGYLEKTKLKPVGQNIKYKTDAQTRAGIYRGGSERPWIYCSSTVRNRLKKEEHPLELKLGSRSDALWWRSPNPRENSTSSIVRLLPPTMSHGISSTSRGSHRVPSTHPHGSGKEEKPVPTASLASLTSPWRRGHIKKKQQDSLAQDKNPLSEKNTTVSTYTGKGHS